MTTTQTEKRIVYEPLTTLLRQQNELNPKDHDLGLIISSIKRFGFKGSITKDVADESVVAGHGRTKALYEMWKYDPDNPPDGIFTTGENDEDWEVPVTYESFANEHERNAYLIADNQAVIAGGWETASLVALLEATVENTEAGLIGLGFDGDDLDNFTALVNGVAGDSTDSSHDGGDINIGYRPERYGVTVNVDDKGSEDILVDLIRGAGFEAKRHSK
jgi:hypothetical protein